MIEEALNSAPECTCVITAYIDRPTWKDMNNNFRKSQDIQLTSIPTLIKVGTVCCFTWVSIFVISIMLLALLKGKKFFMIFTANVGLKEDQAYKFSVIFFSQEKRLEEGQCAKLSLVQMLLEDD